MNRCHAFPFRAERQLFKALIVSPSSSKRHSPLARCDKQSAFGRFSTDQPRSILLLEAGIVARDCRQERTETVVGISRAAIVLPSAALTCPSGAYPAPDILNRLKNNTRCDALFSFFSSFGPYSASRSTASPGTSPLAWLAFEPHAYLLRRQRMTLIFSMIMLLIKDPHRAAQQSQCRRGMQLQNVDTLSQSAWRAHIMKNNHSKAVSFH